MAEKARILIIDDEEIVRDSCIQILAKSNYEIATAENGMEGLDLLKEFQPDLALVDLKMPGISGFEVLDRIHAYDPTIVAIVITGFATVDSAVEAMKKGTYDFLPKPFTPDELRMLVRRGLERRKLVLPPPSFTLIHNSKCDPVYSGSKLKTWLSSIRNKISTGGVP